MTERSIRQTVTVSPEPGTGILHPFPTSQLAHLDPFVFLDTGAPKQLGDREIYVGPHPHRGVQPVSLVFRAEIEHRDSLGNHTTVSSGGMQWLVAGSGALHEEVLRGDDEGVFHMAQLWVNVPAGQKLRPPEHHAVPAEQVPVVDLANAASVQLFAGELAGSSGPAPLGTPVLIALVMLEPGGSVSVPVPVDWNVGLCVVDGSAEVDHRRLSLGATAVMALDGDSVTLSSVHGGQILLMAGEPIGEPIAMGGGFVMNTSQEIDQAFADHRSGGLGQLEPRRVDHGEPTGEPIAMGGPWVMNTRAGIASADADFAAGLI